MRRTVLKLFYLGISKFNLLICSLYCNDDEIYLVLIIPVRGVLIFKEKIRLFLYLERDFEMVRTESKQLETKISIIG